LRIVLILIISLLFCNKGTTQSLDETYALATELFDSGAEKEAALYFQRVIFFGYGKYDAECFQKLADISWKEKDYQQAAIYLNGASAAISDIDIRNEILIKRANALLYIEENQLALQDLLSIGDEAVDSTRKRRDFLLGTIFFLNKEFDQASTFLTACFEKQSDKDQIQAWIKQAAAIKHPNPKKAKKLSKYFPGLGQFYAGDIKNGINSLLLASFFVYTTINTAIVYTYWEAALTIAPWMQRYYQGGYTRAEMIAQNKLDRKHFKYYQKIVDLFDKDSL
jgi:tetratricopeptide (TPR) repeat protein